MIILLRNPEKPVVEEGGGLEINIDGMVIKCDVIVLLFSFLWMTRWQFQQNTPNVFSWSGSFYGLIVGRHIFQFLESEMNPGGTRLVQTEDISGPLQFLFEPWWPEWLGGIERVATNKFNELNGHLKERAERSWSAKTRRESLGAEVELCCTRSTIRV